MWLLGQRDGYLHELLPEAPSPPLESGSSAGSADELAPLVDVGCGSGLSGDRLTELGYQWIGMDISESMLQVAQDRNIEGGVIQ